MESLSIADWLECSRLWTAEPAAMLVLKFPLPRCFDPVRLATTQVIHLEALTFAGSAGRSEGHGAHTAVQQRLILWVRWLLADFLVPLLRAHFYCTESEVYRQEVFYYRWLASHFQLCQLQGFAGWRLCRSLERRGCIRVRSRDISCPTCYRVTRMHCV